MIYKIQDDVLKPETSEDKAKEIVEDNKVSVNLCANIILKWTTYIRTYMIPLLSIHTRA